MFRFKITGYKNGNISIGIVIILSVVLLNLIIVLISIVNMYKGARISEIKAYKDNKEAIENSIKNDNLEKEIINKIKDFTKDVKKDDKSLKEAFTKFQDTPIESKEKYWLAYDKVFNEFFLYSKENNKRKILGYFINDGEISFKFIK